MYCIFHFFQAHNDVFELSFFRALFLHLVKETDSMLGHAAQILKSEIIVQQRL